MNGPSTPECAAQQRSAPGRPSWLIVSVAAIAGIGVAVLMLGGDDEPEVALSATTIADSEPGNETELRLSTGGLNVSAATCPAVDATIIAQAPIAFKGTVTMHGDGVVQVIVDEAYAGVDAQTVTLTSPPGMEGFLGGVAWDVGSQYLVTANSGVVNFCGRSGPATDELQAVFDQAFD